MNNRGWLDGFWDTIEKIRSIGSKVIDWVFVGFLVIFAIGVAAAYAQWLWIPLVIIGIAVIVFHVRRNKESQDSRKNTNYSPMPVSVFRAKIIQESYAHCSAVREQHEQAKEELAKLVASKDSMTESEYERHYSELSWKVDDSFRRYQSAMKDYQNRLNDN